MAPGANKDPFRLLPDDLLRTVLSFLDEDDALQTCVLDTWWRDFWRRTTSLHFLFYEDRPNLYDKCERYEQSVNLIIHLRGNSPLVKCEIGYFPDEETTERLVEYALMCQVQELLVRFNHPLTEQLWYGVPFISQHLKVLQFLSVHFHRSSLDFSNCPVLEDLRMDECSIHAHISSKSLKHLQIIRLCIFPLDFHVRIVAPDLTLLEIDDFEGLTPSLGYMPFLETVYVGLGYHCHDFCVTDGQGCDKRDCGCHAYPVDEGVLLNGLSSAVNLELTTAKSEMNILGATGAEETTDQSFVCAHLKVVNIECKEVREFTKF